MLKMSKKVLYYALALVVLSACLLVAMHYKDRLQPKAKVVVEEIPLVRSEVVKLAKAGQEFTYSGEVCGRYENQLAFQVNGKIAQRNVDLGSAVRAGDLLMQVDPKDIQQVVNSSEAQMNAAQSQLNLATENLNRLHQLYEEKAISKADYDNCQNAYNNAEALLRQTTSQYEQAKNQLNYSNLYADCNGTVSSIDAEIGQVVVAGQSVVSLVQDGEKEVEINVPENRIEELRQAKQIKVKFWAFPDIIVNGKLREVAPMADKVSRTYKVRISLINPPGKIKLGMTSSVIVTGAETAPQQAAASIPLSAIYQTGDAPGVWVVNNAVVHLQPIKIGAFGEDQVQVLKGIKDGDVIVTAGVHKLREGLKVHTTGDAR